MSTEKENEDTGKRVMSRDPEILGLTYQIRGLTNKIRGLIYEIDDAVLMLEAHTKLEDAVIGNGVGKEK